MLSSDEKFGDIVERFSIKTEILDFEGIKKSDIVPITSEDVF